MKSVGQSHFRAVAFVLNGIAMSSQKALVKMLPEVIDQPTPFSMRAIKYKSAPLDVESVRDIESKVFVLDEQSAYFKYQMGTDPRNIRKPGDIGPSDDHIYVPIWKNLARIDIKPINGGTLSRGTLARLAKAAGRSTTGAVTAAPAKAKTRTKAAPRPAVFWGTPVIGGKR